MEHPAPSVAEDHQYEEHPESGGRDCKEIHGDHVGHVIFQKAAPRLGRWFRTGGRHEIGNSSLGDLNSQLE